MNRIRSKCKQRLFCCTGEHSMWDKLHACSMMRKLVDSVFFKRSCVLSEPDNHPPMGNRRGMVVFDLIPSSLLGFPDQMYAASPILLIPEREVSPPDIVAEVEMETAIVQGRLIIKIQQLALSQRDQGRVQVLH